MINFTKKEKSGASGISKFDVSVTYSYPHGKSHRSFKDKTLRFSFSEKAVKMICGEGFYASVGTDRDFPDRIYFCSENGENGYKLSKSEGRGGHRYSCTFGAGAAYTNAAEFVGYYNLEYDARQGALYINRKNKKEI